MLDWDKLKIFYHVANAGSITTAAQNLNISQPALSRSILNLEARIGSKLFNRHKRGITLTREGEILYQGAHNMFLESRNMENALKEKENTVEGELKIMTTPSLSSTWLMKQVPGFLEKYPGVRLKITGLLGESDFNAGDAWIRTYVPMQPTLVQKYLFSFHMRLFASKSYIDKFGMPKTPEDLDHHRLITFGGNAAHPLGNINWILNVGVKSGRFRESFLEVNSTQGLLRAAQLGLGIVELSRGHPKLEGVDLVEVLPNLKGPVVEVFYIYPEHKSGMKKISAFYDYLADYLSKNPDFNKNILSRNQDIALG